MSPGSYVTAAATTAGVLAGAYCAYHLYNETKKHKLPTEWKKVGTLENIFMYPLKSCAGIQKTTAECTVLGLKDGWLRDRILMVVDDKYKRVTARAFPKLLLIHSTMTHSTVTLKCKDMEPLHLDLEQIMSTQSQKEVTVRGEQLQVYDCGWEPEEWFSSDCFTNTAIQNLLDHNMVWFFLPSIASNKYYFTKKHDVLNKTPSKARSSRFLNKTSTGYRLVLFKEERNNLLKFKKTVMGAFADEAPFNLINQASIDDLNTRLKGVQVNHKHFRSNFLLAGAQPYEEDNWKFIKIGDNVFKTNPCTRCIMTTNDPETGVRNSNSEPLETLKSYRQVTDPELRRYAGSAPCMGLQLVLRSGSGGIVSINDTIYVA